MCAMHAPLHFALRFDVVPDRTPAERLSESVSPR